MTIDPESLEHLLLSPGWAAFVAHVEQEWGPTGIRYQQALETALNLTDSEAAASQALQVLAARKTVELLLKWPSEEIRRLKAKDSDPVPAMSRGGYHP